MAGSNRPYAVAAVALPFLFLAMLGIGRAAGTVTNCTTFGPGAGTLEAALTGGGTVTFACSGTIVVPEITIASGTTTVDATGQSLTLSGNNTNSVFKVASGATLNLTNLTIAHGSADGGLDGGGISNDGTLTVANSAFSGDGAPDNGGGIFNNHTLTVTNSTFSGNSAGDFGGGIENRGTLTVTNSTFSGNTVGVFGGGIDNQGTLTVTNSTFSGNSAGMAGGGIENPLGSTTLKGTILAAESTGGNCGGTISDAGFNISDDGSCGFSGASIANSTTLNLAPAGLKKNGGPTQTIALEPTSQAVDFIPLADCTDQSSPTPLALTTDQRGFPRPDPGNPNFCDAGAFELTTSSDFELNNEKVQVARSTTVPNTDQVNMGLTFTHLPDPDCNAADDALHAGITVQLFAGSCSDLTGTGLTLDLDPFAVHSIGGQSYGTIYQSDPPNTLQQTGETVAARIVKLATPEGDCGKWTLNVEVGGLDTVALGLDGNPFALELTDSDLHGFGCFDIDDAIVGSQLDPNRKVRRGARR